MVYTKIMMQTKDKNVKKLMILALFLLMPPAAMATTAPPEVLFIVDTSQSMQYGVGADTLPLCGSLDPTNPDQKSRWNIVREVIGGTFANFQCLYEPLSAVPEAVNPPKQLSGTPSCIPGLAMTLETPYVLPLVSGSTAMATRTFPGGQSGPDDPAASFQTINSGGTYSVRSMWMRFDLNSLPQSANWANASVDIKGVLYNADQPTNVQLVVSPYDLPTPGVDLCGILQLGAQVLSGPVTLPVGTNAGQNFTLSFPLTQPAVQSLQTLRQSGALTATVAVVPADVKFDSLCVSSSGSPKTTVQFVPNSTIGTSPYAPTLTVATGQQCPAEGPDKHSIALGLQALDGSIQSLPSNPDGLIDVYGPTAKFALLAGDNVMNKGVTQVAGFSFADDISSLWGTINMGLADPHLPGSWSVPITVQDDLNARIATFTAIQASLAAIRPNGPTPLASALADAVAYMGPGLYTEPHFKTVAQDPVNGDPYLACRSKIVAVFSDGGANLFNGSTDGRAAAVQSAAALYGMGAKVFVFAVGYPAGSTPTDANWQFLNDLAIAGGTQGAIITNSPADAISALAAPIAGAALQGDVLTHPVFTTATGATGDVQHSFQAISIFDLSQPLRTRGIVEQRIFKCDAACKSDASPNRAQVCGILNYQDRLLKRPVPRRAYTQLTGAKTLLDAVHVSAFDLGLGTVQTKTNLILQADGSCATGAGFDLSDVVQRNAYRDSVLKTLMGAQGTCRQNHPLGAPSRSQPALLEPANRLPIRDPSFRTYANQPAPATSVYSTAQPPGSFGRPTMLFVATHDGLLHAFRTDEDPAITTKDSLLAGDELWSFLPRFSLSRIEQIQLVTSPDASYLNAPLTAQHVLLKRDFASGATSASTAANWRAVVLAGAGEAGAGYVALDVTSPEDPQLMWEISPDRHCYGNTTVNNIPGPTCVLTSKFGQMGRSTVRPVIANLFVNDASNQPSERAVAIIPFGKSPSDSAVSNNGVDGTGERGVYVLDLTNGDILRKFTTSDLVLTGMTATPNDPSSVGYFWTEPSCFNNAAGQITTRCFLGDSKGIVWRMDLSAPNPADWKLRFFFDLYHGSTLPGGLQLSLTDANRVPITTTPSISTTVGGNLAIVIGSGNGDLVTNLTKRDVIVSLREAYNVADDGTALPPLGDLNWLKILDDSERFIGPPIIFASYAFWSTFAVSATGLCDGGTARLWGVRYDRRQTVSDPQDTIGAFPNPQKPADQSAMMDFQSVGQYKPSPVDLQPEPACTNGCPPTNAQCVLGKGGALVGGAPKYELSVAVAGNVQSSYQTPKSGQNGEASVGTVSVLPPQPRTAAIITGWDLLLD